MMYALVKIDPLEIIERWNKVPGRVFFGKDGPSISPASVGDAAAGYLVVDVTVENRDRPTNYHVMGGSDMSLTGNTLTITRVWVRGSGPTKDEVKEAARRRILAVFPEWKQLNMLGRAIELQDIWRQNGSWTQAEQEQYAAIIAAWSWVKSTRSTSDVIEALETIPDDFDADERWQV